MRILLLFSLFFILGLIGCVSTPPQNGEDTEETMPELEVIYSIGFESGSLEDWEPKGDVILETSDMYAHSGVMSLYVSGRSQQWHAPQIDVTDLLTEETNYYFSAWVFIPEDSSKSSAKFTIECLVNGETRWNQIAAPVKITPGEWTLIEGKYSYKFTDEYPLFYIENLDSTAEFYVDDMEISS